MLKITPKNFYYLTIAYTVLIIPLGLWLAEPIIVFSTILVILPTILISKTYLKPPISPTSMNFFWWLPFIVIGAFLLQGLDIKDNFVENKNQLQELTGIIPEKSTYVKSSRFYSTTYLKIADKTIHCADNLHDDCHRIYQYSGQTATIWYQPNTTNGNLAYEIQVNNQPIYEFDKQKALFLEQKKKRTQQWVWTFILLFFIPLWFGWQDRKIRKSLPKMSVEELEIVKNQQMENYEPVGCLGLIFTTFWVGISVSCFVASAIFFMSHDIPTALLCAFIMMVTAIFTYFAAKPKKKNINQK